MKNLFKVFGITVFTAVIVLSMTACGGAGAGTGGGINIGPTNGQLTINGLGDYNGKYVLAAEKSENPPSPSSPLLFGAYSIAQSGVGSHAPVSGGTAVLKIWLCTESDEITERATFVNYNGSGSKTMVVAIHNTETPVTSPIVVPKLIDTAFSSGKATVTWE